MADPISEAKGDILAAVDKHGDLTEERGYSRGLVTGREESATELDRLSGLLTAAQAERDDAIAQLIESRNEATALRTQLSEANQRITELEDRLAEALNANTALRVTVDELMVQLTAAKAEIARLTALLEPGPEPEPELPSASLDGYELHTALRFATKGNYFSRTGTPSNSGANRRDSQNKFGQGPDGTALMITCERINGTLVTGEVTTENMPRFPAWQHRRDVVEFLDPWHEGLTPSPWDRSTNALTEVDLIEWFGLKFDYPHTGTGQAPTAAGLHLDTYNDTPTKHPHKAVQVRKPTSYWAPGTKHVLECRIEPTKIAFWVDGEKQGELLASQFPAGMYAAQMNSTRYFRWCTQANPGSNVNLTGNLPADFTRFRWLVHSSDVFVPA